jgi:hypothetical protein
MKIRKRLWSAYRIFDMVPYIWIALFLGGCAYAALFLNYLEDKAR